MFEFLPLLSGAICIPMFAAFVTLFIDPQNANVAKNSRLVALFSSIVSLMISLYLIEWYARNENGNYIFLESYPIEFLSGFSISWGIDSISLSLTLLSNFLFLIVHILGEGQKHRYREYVVLLLITQGLLIGFFAARDLLLFYILFEATLIPLFFIIGIWGGKERVYAAFKFFLMTFIGSLGFLVALLAIYQQYGTFDMSILKSEMVREPPYAWIWLAMFFAFSVKVPMFFVHTWLPHAHVEAPTTGSMLLAGILLKVGGYGMLRCLLELMPYLTFQHSNFARILSIIAILYASFIAFVQTDMKRMVAYASVGHMGFVTLGFFNLNSNGLAGACFQMVSHGLISAALFLSVGLLYERLHTRDLTLFGGLRKRFPIFVGVLSIYIFGLIGLPGTSGFLGELLVFISTSEVNYIYLLFIAASTVITAGYGLKLFKAIAFGPEILPPSYEEKQLSQSEMVSALILGVFIIILGFFPQPLLSFHQKSLQKISIEHRVIPERSN